MVLNASATVETNRSIQPSTQFNSSTPNASLNSSMQQHDQHRDKYGNGSTPLSSHGNNTGKSSRRFASRDVRLDDNADDDNNDKNHSYNSQYHNLLRSFQHGWRTDSSVGPYQMCQESNRGTPRGGRGGQQSKRAPRRERGYTRDGERLIKVALNDSIHKLW